MLTHAESDLVLVPEALKTELLKHPVYSRVRTLRDVQTFMREHVFAVWDFMSLAKRQQRDVTSVTIPWMPPRDSASVRLINEIVLAEESDANGQGGFASHFELYCRAMDDVGADRGPIDTFLDRLRAGMDVAAALQAVEICDSTRAFVASTIALARSGGPHEVAAAFCCGREDVIPEMFERLLPNLTREQPGLERFRDYLDRHIEVDGDMHGPMARQLVNSLCGESSRKQDEARAAAEQAVRSRIAFWDGIVEQLAASPQP